MGSRVLMGQVGESAHTHTHTRDIGGLLHVLMGTVHAHMGQHDVSTSTVILLAWKGKYSYLLSV